MGMWANHRARQAGKYAKQMAQTAQLQQMQLQQMQMQLATAAHQPQVAPRPQANLFSEGYERGRAEGWSQGWMAGQADLVQKLRTGQVRLEDLP